LSSEEEGGNEESEGEDDSDVVDGRQGEAKEMSQEAKEGKGSVHPTDDDMLDYCELKDYQIAEEKL